MENGKPFIYVKCSKAIYGTLNAAILSYKRLVGHLGDWGFEMNPNEACCWNMYMDNKKSPLSSMSMT